MKQLRSIFMGVLIVVWVENFRLSHKSLEILNVGFTLQMFIYIMYYISISIYANVLFKSNLNIKWNWVFVCSSWVFVFEKIFLFKKVKLLFWHEKCIWTQGLSRGCFMMCSRKGKIIVKPVSGLETSWLWIASMNCLYLFQIIWIQYYFKKSSLCNVSNSSRCLQKFMKSIYAANMPLPDFNQVFLSFLF